MSATATIRVPIETRDAFADLAQARGVSIAQYLAGLAGRERRKAVISAERAAATVDAGNAAATAELGVWGETAGDGID